MADQVLWRGTSPDERAGDRRERLVAACYRIVGDEGSAALTVRAVCRSANVSPRHFYEVFADTDTLLLATYERAVDDLQRAISVAVEEGSPPWPRRGIADRLRSIFDAATRYLEEHPQTGRLIFREALANGALRGRAALTLPAFVHPIRQLALEGSAKPASAYQRLEGTLLSGGLAAAFVEWLSGSAPFSRDELVIYCTQVCLAVLTLPLPQA